MRRKFDIAWILLAATLWVGTAQGQIDVVWGGGDGFWVDENWDDGTGLNTIDAFVGQLDGSNGAGGPNGEDNITISSGTVEYQANDLQSDFRMKQGSRLVINGGATWTQIQDDSWSENRWTEMDLTSLVLDNGTFRRTGIVGDEGGGALIFGSWRGDDNQDSWLPHQETDILITNGGSLENEGSVWFGTPDILPDSIFTMTINDGSMNLIGGDIPPDTDFPFEGALFFFDPDNGSTHRINFTGPGSISVDATGIGLATLDDVTYVTYEELWSEGILQANGKSGPDGENFATYFTVNGAPGQDDYTLAWKEGLEPSLQAGDADQNLSFDQFDVIRVQQSAKYLTGADATWGDGDWNGAPGGKVGEPPMGDGRFDQIDIIAALGTGNYLTGAYAAVRDGGMAGDGQTSVVYDPSNGHVSVDAPSGVELTSVNIDSAGGIFTGEAAQSLGGSFDNDADGNIFKATFGGSFGSVSFGNVAQTGLSKEFMLNDLTVVGSLAGGGDLGDVDLVYVPEPATIGMLVLGLLFWRRRR